MSQKIFPPEFQWLAKLAQDINRSSSFYRQGDAAAIYCPNCQTIQSYCTGCGTLLLDCFDEHNQHCEACGISLASCGICGFPVEKMELAPEGLQKPEYWKYCPACGEAVFATTDMCPHCKISMASHLDAVYEATYQRVSQTMLEEENKLIPLDKAKLRADYLARMGKPPWIIRFLRYLFKDSSKKP